MEILFIVNKKHAVNGELIKYMTEAGYRVNVTCENTFDKKHIRQADIVYLVGVCPKGKKVAKRLGKMYCAVCPSNCAVKKNGIFSYFRSSLRFYRKTKNICCENVYDGYKLIGYCTKSRIFVVPYITANTLLPYTAREISVRLSNAANTSV